MMKKYGIVLGHLMERDGRLSRHSKNRANKAAKLFLSGAIDFIVVSGSNYRPDTSLSLSEAMKNYLVSFHDVPKHLIISDSNSLDTVGDAFFIRKNILSSKVPLEIHVVTSRFHIRRARVIFEFVFGPGYHIAFHQVGFSFNPFSFYSEAKSLSAFYSTFKGVSPGNLNKIEFNLNALHPMYNRTKEDISESKKL